MKKITLTITFLFLVILSYSQQGTIRGTIIDKSTGETIPFATLFVHETSTGTTSDLDGAYSLDLPVGNYTITFSFLGYSDFTISEVIIKENEVNVLNINMKEEGQMIEEVVVTAKQLRNTEAAFATIKRKTPKLLDGTTAQSMSSRGDSDAGEAIKRVTGVSVEGGKHVYVRGLGDRYTKTLLNGMDIPGLDPDRNSVEMDIFPSNLIDNILVYKAFSPDLPGDFTGGVVDIVTKDFPDQRTSSISISAGFNPDMHFNDNFIQYRGSNTDVLGFDDGLRALPVPRDAEILNPVLDDPNTEMYTRSFSPVMSAQTKRNNLNKSISFSTGNQVTSGDTKYGYILALNLKNNSKFYEDAEFNTYIFDQEQSSGQFNLTGDKTVIGDVGHQEAFWSALLGGSVKHKSNRFGLNILRLQNGVSSAARQTVVKTQSSSATLVKDVLEYSERSVTSINLSGKHLLEKGKLEVEWKLSPTFVEVDEPDIRVTSFEKTGEGTFQLAPAVGADVSRTWRNLKESNYSGKADLTWTTKLIGDLDSKIKGGISGTVKERDFGIDNFIFRVLDQSALNLDGVADNIFAPENIWTPGSDQGTYVKGGYEPANTFNSKQQILAAYVMNELAISEKFKAVYGLRVEKADTWYTGINNDGSISYDNEKVLDEVNILPSVNLIYAVKEGMNLRFSYNKTLARPTFKEKSIAQIQDRISGRTFLGNIELGLSEIDNIDLRWEMFAQGGQVFSISGFYKYFVDPIELVPFADFAPDNFIPRSLGNAEVYGIEFEIRKKLDFIGSAFEKFIIGSNLTIVDSSIERTTGADTGETERQMAGQSPYIFNANLMYSDSQNGWEANASYNIQGKRLYIVGAGSLADVYDQPFNSLNAKVSKRFGKDDSWKMSVSASNLLGDSKEKLYESPGSDTAIFERLNPGSAFSLGLSYTIK